MVIKRCLTQRWLLGYDYPTMLTHLMQLAYIAGARPTGDQCEKRAAVTQRDSHPESSLCKLDVSKASYKNGSAQTLDFLSQLSSLAHIWLLIDFFHLLSDEIGSRE